MSQRYRRERARNGMIADPVPLNVNNNEYAGEFNGYVERENIPSEAIVEAMIVAGTFVRVLDDPKTDTITLDSASQEWQRNDVTTGDAINQVTDTLAVDALVHVEWSGSIEWAGATTGDCYRVQLVINGIAVASTGFLSSAKLWQGPALSGDLPQQAGPLDVYVEAMIANVSQTIESPGIFTIVGPVTNTLALKNRSLVVEVRSR